MIERKQYLDQLISKKENGMIKVITGIRRCGKSYLLFEIYHQYLNSIGVDDEHIIELALDDDENIRYRNPIELGEYIRSLLVDKDKMYYIFLDEIQKVKTIKNPYLDDSDDTVGFVDVLLGLMKKKNADVYVTGSNSRMLSSDILTEFRGRGDEVRVYPLTFAEFYAAFEGDKHDAWQEYYTYGGMPYVSRLKDHRSKAQYLTDLFENIYLKDILERHNIQDKNVLDDLLDVISSAVGSLTNPSRIADTFASINQVKISPETIARYLDCGCFYDQTRQALRHQGTQIYRFASKILLLRHRTSQRKTQLPADRRKSHHGEHYLQRADCPWIHCRCRRCRIQLQGCRWQEQKDQFRG